MPGERPRRKRKLPRPPEPGTALPFPAAPRVMALFEQMRANVGKLLRGIDRYNPENLATLERYVETQAKENAYDLEANLAVLKLYQFNPAFFQTTVTAQILLKALTNLPHTDFTLCKCMIDQAHVSAPPPGGAFGEPPSTLRSSPMERDVPFSPVGPLQEERPIRQILYLGELLETCHFQSFWQALDENMELLDGITGFEDSVRKCEGALGGLWGALGGPAADVGSPSAVICHVVGITYQHIDRWLLAEMLGDLSGKAGGDRRVWGGGSGLRAEAPPYYATPPEAQLKVWMSKYGWTEPEPGRIFICNQEESIKPKNIVEKIDFDSGCRGPGPPPRPGEPTWSLG
ncbi:EIF3K factor, partial [Calonectris borealis]|nr:EIF3K factor [Calonectris borealis]